MSLISGLGKYIVKGTKAAEANAALKEAISKPSSVWYGCWFPFGGKSKSCKIRNGIALFEENADKGYGVTKIRRFFRLNEKGQIEQIKTKGVSHKSSGTKAESRVRTNYHTLGIGTYRHVTSVNGRITEYRNTLHKGSVENIDGNSFVLGFGNSGLMKNIKENSFVRFIEDIKGKRGSAFAGRIDLPSGTAEIKGYFNPNLTSGCVTGLPGSTKAKLLTKEQYDTLLYRIKSAVHGFSGAYSELSKYIASLK